MTSFEAGFIKYAQECGLSDEEAAHTLKRAMEYPGTQQMFKQLPEEDDVQQPEDLETLKQLLHQELIDKNMSSDMQSINI